MAKSRAFQKVPRYLRRRAASHNPKKVPLRLRAKAIQEQLTDPVKPLKKKSKQLRKLLLTKTRNRHTLQNPRYRSKEIQRRQRRSGQWLETHMWHAKRFKMRKVFGSCFKLPKTPTQKSARAMYRACRHTSVVHDSSYLSLYELTGPDIQKLVGPLFDPNGPNVFAHRYTCGKYKTESVLYETFPTKLISPVTVVWQSPDRLWIWVHPLTDEILIKVLAYRMDSLAISTVRVEQVTDVCRISLAGPKCLGMLASVLKLADSGTTTLDTGNTYWNQTICRFGGTSSPDALRTNQVVALNVWDPRLSYPPKRPVYSDGPGVTTPETHSVAPHQSGLWSATVRQSCFKSKQTEHALNTRRHKNLVPGTPLVPNPDLDTQIPLLVFHSKTAFNLTPHSSNQKSSSFLPGLDVLVPKGWALPLWRSLVWAGARVAGTDCIRTIAFEHQCLLFPFDFPTTSAYIDVHLDSGSALERKWLARPKSKRVNYTKLGTYAPFYPNWSVLAQSFIPWLVSPSLVKDLFYTQQQKVNQYKVIKTLNEISAVVSSTLSTQTGYSIESAFVHVTVTLLGRGTVNENGVVYSMPQHQVQQWKLAAESVQSAALNHGFLYLDAETNVPKPRKLIGYVTFGRFSLAIGQACAVAVVRLMDVIGIKYVLVRGTTGHVVYPAKIMLCQP